MRYTEIQAEGLQITERMERLNDAISYIEEHLTDEIDLEQLTPTALCSGSPTVKRQGQIS